jgi:hypothetical protein
MKVIKFSFKREAVWMIAFGLAPVVIGLLILFVLWALR